MKARKKDCSCPSCSLLMFIISLFGVSCRDNFAFEVLDFIRVFWTHPPTSLPPPPTFLHLHFLQLIAVGLAPVLGAPRQTASLQALVPTCVLGPPPSNPSLLQTSMQKFHLVSLPLGLAFHVLCPHVCLALFWPSLLPLPALPKAVENRFQDRPNQTLVKVATLTMTI